MENQDNFVDINKIQDEDLLKKVSNVSISKTTFSVNQEPNNKDGLKNTVSENTVLVSSSNLSCSICYEICQIPLESNCCGCIVCKYCYQIATKDISQNKFPCPSCRKIENKFSESRIIRRVIDSIRTECIIDNCGKIVERECILSHIKEKHDTNDPLVRDIMEKYVIKELAKEWPICDKFAIHRHLLYKQTNNEGFCNAKKFVKVLGNCKKIINKEDEFYLCKSCNLWFCLNCVEKECSNFFTAHHKHPLELTFLDKGWQCDGAKLPEHCRSGNHINFSTEMRLRYRCLTCDYDLCGNCMQFYDKY